jgi:hypothetical protein
MDQLKKLDNLRKSYLKAIHEIAVLKKENKRLKEQNKKEVEQ